MINYRTKLEILLLYILWLICSCTYKLDYSNKNDTANFRRTITALPYIFYDISKSIHHTEMFQLSSESWHQDVSNKWCSIAVRSLLSPQRPKMFNLHQDLNLLSKLGTNIFVHLLSETFWPLILIIFLKLHWGSIPGCPRNNRGR